jgi:hypothetical protein
VNHDLVVCDVQGAIRAGVSQAVAEACAEHRCEEELVTTAVAELAAKGVPVEQATAAAMRVIRRRPVGMGQELVPVAAVESVRATVSPWLWILSLASFGMAFMNTRRISKMYGGWRGVQVRRR